jgi:REP element-mobilizing transposase RayT
MLGEIFHDLARQKECRSVEGHLLSDQVHRCLEIPPKHAVASVIGFLKGKSALAIARRVQVCSSARPRYTLPLRWLSVARSRSRSPPLAAPHKW